MIPNFSTDRAALPAEYRDRLLSQIDRCMTTADRQYLLETVVSYPKFAIALDELLVAGWVEIKRRARRRRNHDKFGDGAPFLSEPALYRKPGTRAAWLKEVA